MGLTPFVNHWGRKRWPRYRGRRAGKQFKSREKHRQHQIGKVYPRPLNREATRTARSRNLLNCVFVPVTAPNITSLSDNQQRVFVPSLLLSNVMSLSPKIDEVRDVVLHADFDLVCITETWLRDHIPENIVAIHGYNLIRRDRINDLHGGVCVYVKDTIKYQVVRDLMN
ncbi:uncharacterized protein LOC114575459, partial [Exaiptasia diaphana]|uniref:Endonuclease/exonuclease/phosphatase domain-containing protein n=1 Tax=Exaiptasia diaphana TaxID=2652724 RepID=A0A913YLY0_EXADI